MQKKSQSTSPHSLAEEPVNRVPPMVPVSKDQQLKVTKPSLPSFQPNAGGDISDKEDAEETPPQQILHELSDDTHYNYPQSSNPLPIKTLRPSPRQRNKLKQTKSQPTSPRGGAYNKQGFPLSSEMLFPDKSEPKPDMYYPQTNPYQQIQDTESWKEYNNLPKNLNSSQNRSKHRSGAVTSKRKKTQRPPLQKRRLEIIHSDNKQTEESSLPSQDNLLLLRVPAHTYTGTPAASEPQTPRDYDPSAQSTQTSQGDQDRDVLSESDINNLIPNQKDRADTQFPSGDFSSSRYKKKSKPPGFLPRRIQTSDLGSVSKVAIRLNRKEDACTPCDTLFNNLPKCVLELCGLAEPVFFIKMSTAASRDWVFNNPIILLGFFSLISISMLATAYQDMMEASQDSVKCGKTAYPALFWSHFCVFILILFAVTSAWLEQMLPVLQHPVLLAITPSMGFFTLALGLAAITNFFAICQLLKKNDRALSPEEVDQEVREFFVLLAKLLFNAVALATFILIFLHGGAVAIAVCSALASGLSILERLYRICRSEQPKNTYSCGFFNTLCGKSQKLEVTNSVSNIIRQYTPT